MHLGSLKSFDWDVIAHEYGHAVACLQSATRAEGGFHDGSNPYDIEKNPSGEALNTCRNKELSNALALNEAYAAWFALNFWKERRYSSEIAWLGGHRLDQTCEANQMGNPMDLESNAKPLWRETVPCVSASAFTLAASAAWRLWAGSCSIVLRQTVTPSAPAGRITRALPAVALIGRSRGRRFLGALRRFGMALWNQRSGARH